MGHTVTRTGSLPRSVEATIQDLRADLTTLQAEVDELRDEENDDN